ncbi:MAG: sigma-70 family RNA polymerase sigma factor [Deltaproteobacteria bacterium]|nr:sigma-70 family RNA polymerase sigma factor [Deltaproteobacteria bacterium]
MTPTAATYSLACRHSQPLDFLTLAGTIAGRLSHSGAAAGELRAEALFGFAQSMARFDPARGPRALTHAYWRMYGQPRDLLRRERRLAHLRQVLATRNATAPLQRTSTPLAVRQVLRQVGRDLSTREALVLREVYYGDRSLNEAAALVGESADALGRAHKRLLERLRGPLAQGLGLSEA